MRGYFGRAIAVPPLIVTVRQARRMGLLSKLKGAFGGRTDRLSDVAGEPEGSDIFVKALAEHGVWVIGKNLDSQAGSIDFLEHTEGDQSYFPVFSSQDAAAEFVRQLDVKEITAFACFGGSPAVLLDNDFEVVILNPTTASEREISRAEIAALRVLCHTQQDSDEGADNTPLQRTIGAGINRLFRHMR